MIPCYCQNHDYSSQNLSVFESLDIDHRPSSSERDLIQELCYLRLATLFGFDSFRPFEFNSNIFFLLKENCCFESLLIQYSDRERFKGSFVEVSCWWLLFNLDSIFSWLVTIALEGSYIFLSGWLFVKGQIDKHVCCWRET